MSTDNPFCPPSNKDVPPPEPGRTRWNAFTTSWTFVYGLNLLVPGFFASMIAGGSALGGVVITVTLIWFAGTVLATVKPRVAKVLCQGGSVVAVSQFMPILQLTAGLLALELFDHITAPGVSRELPLTRITTFFGGVFVTTVTASVLLAASAGLGYLIYAATRFLRSYRGHVSRETQIR